MALLQVDKLNNLKSEVNRLMVLRKIREYFEAMLLPESSIDKRIELASSLELATRELFEYVEELKIQDEEDAEDILRTFYFGKVYGIVQKYTPSVNRKNIEKYVQMIVHTSWMHDASFFGSSDRAFKDAVDFANFLANDDEYQKAKKDGKLYKVWRTALDEKVRTSHQMVESEMVGIDETFIVGGYPMMYPLDFSLGAPANEIANCRCSVDYI